MMAAENYHYIEAHLDAGQRGFFDVASLLMEAEGHTQEQALQQAAIATMGMQPGSAEAQANWQRVNDMATRVVNQSDHWTGAGWQVTNQNDVKVEVNRLTTLYMLAGLGEEKALAAAQTAYQRTHTNVAQAYIKNDPRVDMGAFKVMVDDYMAWWLDHPDQDGIDWEYDLGDLSIAEVGNGPGSYQIVDARTRIGMVGYPNFSFTLESLQEWQRIQDEIDREEALDTTVANATTVPAQQAADDSVEAELRHASDHMGPVVGVPGGLFEDVNDPGPVEDPSIRQMRPIGRGFD
jgi:hypothetical protein